MSQTRVLPTTNGDHSRVPTGRDSFRAKVADYQLERNRLASDIEDIARLKAAL